MQWLAFEEIVVVDVVAVVVVAAVSSSVVLAFVRLVSFGQGRHF